MTMPNQLGIDSFDLDDAEGEGRDHLASPDLRAFLEEHDLDLTLRPASSTGFGAAPSSAGGSVINPREAFGSHTDSDHVYNTPRAWYMQRTLNPTSEDWDGPGPGNRPDSDDLAWSRRPERKLTIEDVKDVLSSHYQGTPFDPYSAHGNEAQRRAFRPIGINRHNALAILQIRPDRPESSRALQWIAYASNPFTTLIPMFTNVDEAPEYLATTTAQVSTDSFYWTSRLLATLADAHFADAIPLIERYQQTTLALGHAAVHAADGAVSQPSHPSVPDGSSAAGGGSAGDGAAGAGRPGAARRGQHRRRRADPRETDQVPRRGAAHDEQPHDEPVLPLGRLRPAREDRTMSAPTRGTFRS